MRRGRKTKEELRAEAPSAGRAQPRPRHPPTPPARLQGNKLGLRHFRRMAVHLIKRPDFESLDIQILTRLALALADHERIQAELDKTGPIVLGGRSGSRRVPNELLAIKLRFERVIADLEDSLGIGERARKRRHGATEAARKRDDGGKDSSGSLPFAIA